MDCRVPEHAQWFSTFRESEDYRRLQVRPIAYFSMEFALSDRLPTYAGGLGVLASDVVSEASDCRIPMIGVGLWYHDGSDGKPEETEFALVTDDHGTPRTVRVPIQDRDVLVRAYLRRKGTASILLLTTAVEGNSAGDYGITSRLYPPDKERRLHQEMVLGIGGLRMLESDGIHPVAYHLNEGHSAMLALEIIQHEMRERMIGFRDALALARTHIVFTNHTLLPAGNDVFSNDLVAANLARYASELAIPLHDLIGLGLVQESSLFSMTMLSLRLSGRINAVSRLHASKAAQMWTDHPMVTVTNGIHIPTWDRIGNNQVTIDQVTNDQITSRHKQNKRALLEYIGKETGVRWTDDVLLLGWGRRLVAYKRPLALFADPDRFCGLAHREGLPIRVVIAGDVQDGDEESYAIRKQLRRLIAGPLRDCVVLLPDYNLEVAGLMTAGCDVWLNTPIVGFEACGTSGMKAALNGVLPCSTLDGWIDEIELYQVGWGLDSDRVSDHLLELLEREIAPMFFDKRRRAEWNASMANARRLILDRFSTTRVLRQYIEKLYRPVIETAFGQG